MADQSAPPTDLVEQISGYSPLVLSAMESFYATHTGGLNLAMYFERGGGRFPFEALESYGAQLWPDFGRPDAFSPRAFPGEATPALIVRCAISSTSVGRWCS